MSNDAQNIAWDFEDEDKTFELVREIRHRLYDGYYTYTIGDDFFGGLEYVVKNLEEIQGLDLNDQVKLVRMGYSELADNMWKFSHALRSVAGVGTTASYGFTI